MYLKKQSPGGVSLIYIIISVVFFWGCSGKSKSEIEKKVSESKNRSEKKENSKKSENLYTEVPQSNKKSELSGSGTFYGKINLENILKVSSFRKKTGELLSKGGGGLNKLFMECGINPTKNLKELEVFSKTEKTEMKKGLVAISGDFEKTKASECLKEKLSVLSTGIFNSGTKIKVFGNKIIINNGKEKLSSAISSLEKTGFKNETDDQLFFLIINPRFNLPANPEYMIISGLLKEFDLRINVMLYFKNKRESALIELLVKKIITTASSGSNSVLKEVSSLVKVTSSDKLVKTVIPMTWIQVLKLMKMFRLNVVNGRVLSVPH
ncbi:MAG: hypothetical protein JXR95_08840 [Deltaproteobacteria bacterium]|nr:hypothetical protein [Deltaproteobacteria bacterium]